MYMSFDRNFHKIFWYLIFYLPDHYTHIDDNLAKNRFLLSIFVLSCGNVALYGPPKKKKGKK